MTYLIFKPNTLIKRAKKYQTSSLPSQYKKQKLQTLIEVIEKDSLFLDANFSLRSLADKSGISTHHISQILNEELKTSFFQLTNEYRIGEAKKRLKEENKHLKIEYCLLYTSDAADD